MVPGDSTLLVRERSLAPSPRATRVLAFTPSYGRPVMLRHCVMQMQLQTHAVDHAIFVNAPGARLQLDYRPLLARIPMNPSSRLVAGFGATEGQHANALAALALVDLDAYDLFLKVDDDDVYEVDYVELCVRDFERRRWDFSGAPSVGYLDDREFNPGGVWEDLGYSEDDVALGVDPFMPPTMAFSRKALDVVMALEDNGFEWEDVQWRQAIYRDPGLVKRMRPGGSFHYNRHPRGVSNPNGER
jgi:hypothetical protein